LSEVGDVEMNERTMVKRTRRRVVLTTGAALVAGGSVAAFIGTRDASGTPPRPTSDITVFQADGARAPAVARAAAAELERQMSQILPGYQLSVKGSYDYRDGDASYVHVSGSAPGVGEVAISVYRKYDTSELRAAKLPERTVPQVGTFWVGAIEPELTSVYFQPTGGRLVWVGGYALTIAGPAPALAEVETFAARIAGLPAVTAISEEE
jgi:hypothetical protein